MNGTRISDDHNLVKFCLRLKEVIKAHCVLFDAPSLLMEEQWRAAAKIEAVLHNTSRLTKKIKMKKS